jgi:hypothetical protein
MRGITVSWKPLYLSLVHSARQVPAFSPYYKTTGLIRHLLFTSLQATPHPTKHVNFKCSLHVSANMIIIRCLNPFLMTKLLSYVVNIVYAGPFDALVCWSWCVVFFLAVCSSACLVHSGTRHPAKHTTRKNTSTNFSIQAHRRDLYIQYIKNRR